MRNPRSRTPRYDTQQAGAISRRDALGLGGLGALALAGAGLGGGSAAVWNKTEGLTVNPIVAGNLDISQGQATSYYMPVISPETNSLPQEGDGVSGLTADGTRAHPFYRMSSDVFEPERNAFTAYMMRLVDLTVINTGDNMIAKLDIDTSGPPDMRVERASVVYLCDRIDHPDSFDPSIFDVDSDRPISGDPFKPLAYHQNIRGNDVLSLNPLYDGVYDELIPLDGSDNPIEGDLSGEKMPAIESFRFPRGNTELTAMIGIHPSELGSAYGESAALHRALDVSFSLNQIRRAQ